MATGDLKLAQTTALIMSTGAEEGSAASRETLVAYPSLEVSTTQDSTRTSISEALVVTSEMRKLLIQLALAILGVPSAPPSSSESAPATVLETWSMNTPATLHQLWTP